MGISKTMQNYCGETKCDELLNIGLSRLKEYEEKIIPNTFAYNPHELVRLLEVFDILTVSQLIIESCLARKASSKPLCFYRNDELESYSGQDKKIITIKQVNNKVSINELCQDYFGDLKENYELFNKEYVMGK